MKRPSQHIEWLSLIEVSGPFLAVGLLEKAFPQGLEKVETPRRQKLRAAYDEWCEAVDESDRELLALHREWVQLVLADILEYSREGLSENNAAEAPLEYRDPEHGVAFSPGLVVRSDGDTKPRLLISVYPPGTDLEKVKTSDGWPVSLMERMVLLCRSTGVRLGLLTNGERWMLVNAPVGATSSHASWYARLWFQEPLTLKAFQSLLGIRRFFGPADETLDSLLEKSLEYQEEVTDTLGAQVRRAVEVLVQCLDKADQDRNRELLRDVSPSELYEAGLTVMMRLVFVLCAEERGLLLLGDPIYDQCYAVSTLRGHLGDDAERHGPEVLERRHDAWTRLLSVFRAVYGGIEHESMRLPAMGGSLFDPDRFPFLEGRLKDTRWRETPAAPLPIDNRTVLLLLEALQVLEQPGGALLLSYRALDVEQIGHVYEGLLEHTVARVPDITVGLVGSKKAKNPNLPLADLESARMDGDATLLAVLLDATQRSEPALSRDLAREVDMEDLGRVLLVCGGDMDLAERIRPFASLLRTDAWGEPIIYRANSFMVTLGADRKETGTHYTPKSLTEAIVTTSLEPITFAGPAEGLPRDSWTLKPSAALLDLKICDPAMGSGAFLVQACRWLGERLVEAWGKEEAAGFVITAQGKALDRLAAEDPMPDQLEERLIMARRLVAERCLYGVDINPLAVELAKLSIWLVTLAKGRPFGFLDHNLRSGDSLLGVHQLGQLTEFSMVPSTARNRAVFASDIEREVSEALTIRKELRNIPILDLEDIQAMERLNTEAHHRVKRIRRIADALVGLTLLHAQNPGQLIEKLGWLSHEGGMFIRGNEQIGTKIDTQARQSLCTGISDDTSLRRPFHWVLEFPEVFDRSGFDAVVGNPPFMFGKNITANFGGAYNSYLCHINPAANKNVDLCAHFFVRAFSLVRNKASVTMLASSSISEGVTGVASLGKICSEGGSIFSARTKIKWPGKAAVYVATVGIFKGQWRGDNILDGGPATQISSLLTDEDNYTPEPLKSNESLAFVGVIPNGSGLFIAEDEYKRLLIEDPRGKDVLCEYITGEDLNSSPDRPRRYIINFWDWPLTLAKRHPAVLRIVEERVRPHRATLSDAKNRARENWWLYEASAKNLFHAIGKSGSFIRKPKGESRSLSRAIAIARISKTAAFTYVSTEAVFAAEVVVIASDDYAMFAILQSAIHLAFAWNRAGKMKTDLRYSPTLCFSPFPFPDFNNSLRAVGETLYLARQRIIDTTSIGLTELYGRIHNPDVHDSDVEHIRILMQNMDRVTVESYGWNDIKLDHGFQEVPYLPDNDRIRYTICEHARYEVLRRLSRLNAEYARGKDSSHTRDQGFIKCDMGGDE